MTVVGVIIAFVIFSWVVAFTAGSAFEARRLNRSFAVPKTLGARPEVPLSLPECAVAFREFMETTGDLTPETEQMFADIKDLSAARERVGAAVRERMELALVACSERDDALAKVVILERQIAREDYRARRRGRANGKVK